MIRDLTIITLIAAGFAAIAAAPYILVLASIAERIENV